MIAVVALVGLLVLGCNGPEFYTYKRGTGRTIGPFATEAACETFRQELQSGDLTACWRGR